MCISPRRAIVAAAKVTSTVSARTASIRRRRSTTTSTVTASISIRASGTGTAAIVLPASPCGLSSKNNMPHDYIFIGSLSPLRIGDPIFCINIGLRDAVGSCPSPVFVWSFPFLLVLCPSGTHEILGTKVGSPGTTSRNAVAIGREFCRQPSAFCLQNGYSRKIPDQFLGS